MLRRRVVVDDEPRAAELRAAPAVPGRVLLDGDLARPGDRGLRAAAVHLALDAVTDVREVLLRLFVALDDRVQRIGRGQVGGLDADRRVEIQQP